MNNAVRFLAITAVLIIAALLLLAVGGVLSSSELWHSVVKVAEVIGILLVTAGVILALARK